MEKEHLTRQVLNKYIQHQKYFTNFALRETIGRYMYQSFINDISPCNLNQSLQGYGSTSALTREDNWIFTSTCTAIPTGVRPQWGISSVVQLFRHKHPLCLDLQLTLDLF